MNGKVVGLYAVLARDAIDFIEFCQEEDKETLELLAKVLKLPNSKHSRDTVELNAIGYDIVMGILENR